MRTNEMTPAPLQRAEGQAIPEETAAAPNFTALRRHARRIIAARYFHEMQREQWRDQWVSLL